MNRTSMRLPSAGIATVAKVPASGADRPQAPPAGGTTTLRGPRPVPGALAARFDGPAPG